MEQVELCKCEGLVLSYNSFIQDGWVYIEAMNPCAQGSWCLRNANAMDYSMTYKYYFKMLQVQI